MTKPDLKLIENPDSDLGMMLRIALRYQSIARLHALAVETGGRSEALKALVMLKQEESRRCAATARVALLAALAFHDIDQSDTTKRHDVYRELVISEGLVNATQDREEG